MMNYMPGNMNDNMADNDNMNDNDNYMPDNDDDENNNKIILLIIKDCYNEMR